MLDLQAPGKQIDLVAQLLNRFFYFFFTAGLTKFFPVMTLDTVATETPACSATSFILTISGFLMRTAFAAAFSLFLLLYCNGKSWFPLFLIV